MHSQHESRTDRHFLAGTLPLTTNKPVTPSLGMRGPKFAGTSSQVKLSGLFCTPTPRSCKPVEKVQAGSRPRPRRDASVRATPPVKSLELQLLQQKTALAARTPLKSAPRAVPSLGHRVRTLTCCPALSKSRKLTPAFFIRGRTGCSESWTPVGSYDRGSR